MGLLGKTINRALRALLFTLSTQHQLPINIGYHRYGNTNKGVKIVTCNIVSTGFNHNCAGEKLMVRCATPALDMILASWKQEKSPYDDPAYDIPTCQRDKIIPEPPKKQVRCATPGMDMIFKLEAEYAQRIATCESEEAILQSWKDRGA